MRNTLGKVGNGLQTSNVTQHKPAVVGSKPQQNNNAIPHRIAYPAKEAAALLGGISTRTLQRLEQRGLIHPSRGLRIKLYSAQEIERYLEVTT